VRLGEYLFKRLKEEGVTHTFGLPGDFALSLYAAQEACDLPTIVMTHEPSVGYAADVYARLKGLGVALVTYGVGALNMANAVAMAYAEESPVLVIAGAPQVQWRESDALFHHRVKSPDTQLRVYGEVTVAQASIQGATQAAEEIERVLAAVRRFSRPGFIEIARDAVNMPILVPSRKDTAAPADNGSRRAAMREAIDEIAAALNASRRPVVYPGVEIERFGLMDKLRRFVERVGLPVATSLMGKAVLPESHANFIGNYFGRLGPEPVRHYVESFDCILALGMLMTDMDTGLYTGHLDRRRLIQATAQGTHVGYHFYPDVSLTDLLDALLRQDRLKRHRFMPSRRPAARRPSSAGNALSMNSIIEEPNEFLTPDHIVLADTGDCLFASVELRSHMFIGPGYYASMGLAVPGAIAAQLARPDLRPVALVGDGAFKMNGVEIGTACDHGLNPIVIIINNRSFATLKVALGDRPYLRVRPWDYVALARALGGQGVQARTRDEFRRALRLAESSKDFCVIDAVIDPADVSPTLRRLGEQYRAKRSG